MCGRDTGRAFSVENLYWILCAQAVRKSNVYDTMFIVKFYFVAAPPYWTLAVALAIYVNTYDRPAGAARIRGWISYPSMSKPHRDDFPMIPLPSWMW